MTGTIVQISSSKGGVPKLPMLEAVIGELGIEGDAVANPDIHGGPEQAVCLFSAERIDALVAEGHPISPGSTGENITIRGIDWDLVVPKTRLQLGDEVVLEITRQTTPCTTIRGSFKDKDSNRIHNKVHPGWSRMYAKVLSGGTVRPGDSATIA
jgi:MOSC domain-containing protein YiiM